jgi:hypothetical protein
MLKKILWLNLIVFFLAKALLAQETPPQATIIEIVGQVMIKSKEEKQWRVASIGMLLFEGDNIRTNETSRATIVFADGAKLRMNVNTDLIIKRKKKFDLFYNFIDMVVGEIRANVFKKDVDFEVKTPSAIAAVRGTEFNLKAKEDETILIVYSGKIEFFNEFGKVLVEISQMSIAKLGQIPSQPVTIDLKKIPDWTKEKTSMNNLQIIPESPLIEKGKAINLKIEVVSLKGKIDKKYQGRITLASDSSTMCFSNDGGKSWEAKDVKLTKGRAEVLVKDNKIGKAVITATGENLVQGVTCIQIIEEKVKKEEEREKEELTILIELDIEGKKQRIKMEYKKE